MTVELREVVLRDKLAAMLADVALLPFVRQFAAVDTEWFAAAPYAAVRAWLERFTASELFALAMQKFPAWQPDNEPIIFGN